KARAVGPFSPGRVALGAVLPGRRLPWASKARANTLTVLLLALATKRVPRASTARAMSPASPWTVALGAVVAGRRLSWASKARANTLTVLLLALATKRLPPAWTARAMGPASPVRVALGVVLPGANTLTVVPEPWNP